MIIRLTEAQISHHWEAIKDMLDRAVPDIPGQLMNRDNNILRSLMMGESVCWIGYKKVSEKHNDIIGMMITRLMSDDITGIRSILIYCLAGWETMSDRFYREGFVALRDYGKEAHCGRILFYSDEPRMLDVAEKLGFDTSLRYGIYSL
jgi:hypothetical protein